MRPALAAISYDAGARLIWRVVAAGPVADSGIKPVRREYARLVPRHKLNSENSILLPPFKVLRLLLCVPRLASSCFAVQLYDIFEC